jgi:hypothetical protein
MRYFSTKFSSLLESMKSDSRITEAWGKDRTAAGDKVSKVERKQKRYADRFSDQSGKFKMNAFINVLELLRDQIIGEVNSIMNTARSGSAGFKYWETNLDLMNSLKNRVMDLLTTAYERARREGGKLELGEDDDIIRTFRDQYSDIALEYQELSKKWLDAKNKDIAERPVDQSNKELEEKIQTIKDLLDGAKKLLTKSNVQISKEGDKNVTKDGDKKGDKEGDKIEQVTDTIKQRNEAYTGKEGDIVKAVKLKIYQRFKGTKLAEQPDWKIVYKNPNNITATLRGNTANIIRGVKGGLAKKYNSLAGDTTGNITKAFVEVLTSLKEGLSVDRDYKIISFSDFMKTRVNESDDFDFDAAISIMKAGESSSSSSSSSKSKSNNSSSDVKAPEYSATPFTKQEEGDEFRAWVIKNKADWAKNNDLSPSGPINNTYIKKAYAEFGEDYKKSKEAPAVVKKEEKLSNAELEKIKNKIEAAGCKTQLQLAKSTKDPVILYYKGKEYGHFYNNFKVSYVTSSGKVFWGTYDPKTSIVTFGKGKAWDLKYVVKFTISDKLSGEKAETAQSKKAYVAKSGEGYVNVRRNPWADTKGGNANLIYKHTDKSKQIGVVVSSQLTKSTKIGDKTWYKVQFPEKIKNNEYGYVRADTVDLK